MTNLPGYDAWKLADPYYRTAAQEAAATERYHEMGDNLREWIADVLADHRGDLYLADVRRIVIEELNKMAPRAGEPAWQTKTPVPVPPLG
jgi:hypothetical protein